MVEIAAAVIVSIIVLVFAFQYQKHPSTNSLNNTQSTNQTKHFLTASQAFKQIPDKFFPPYTGRNMTAIFQNSRPQFLFLKYNGTVSGSRFENMSYPSFVAYGANSTTGAIGGKIGGMYFDGSRGRLFLNSTEDRYAWSFISEYTMPSITRTYVDAESGAIVGFYNPCPYCVWKPYLEKNFYP